MVVIARLRHGPRFAINSRHERTLRGAAPPALRRSRRSCFPLPAGRQQAVSAAPAPGSALATYVGQPGLPLAAAGVAPYVDPAGQGLGPQVRAVAMRHSRRASTVGSKAARSAASSP